MADKEKIKVLVVDDEKVIRDFLTRLLTLDGLEVKSAEDGDKALELAQKEKFDLVFLDIKMPKMNGVEAFSRLKKLNPDLACVFMTGYASEMALLDKTKQPGTICLRKPFEDIKQIREIAHKALEEAQAATGTQRNTPDRRAYVRLNIVLEVDYRLMQKREPFIHSSGKNIALGGIELTVAEDIAPGAILELIMRVKGNDRVCRAVGEVAWNKAVKDKPGYYETGIEFLEIDYSQLAAMLINYT